MTNLARKSPKLEFYDKFGTKHSILTKSIKTNKAELKMKDFTEIQVQIYKLQKCANFLSNQRSTKTKDFGES